MAFAFVTLLAAFTLRDQPGTVRAPARPAPVEL
jgi:hypothetical protein